MPRRRTVSPAYKESLKKAKQERLEQRARLIGAGLITKPTRRSKYNQIKTVYLGERYDSLGEAEYAFKLTQRQLAGEIRAWNRPPAIVLVNASSPRDRITYKPDFEIKPLNGPAIYVDYKGSHVTETAAWRIKVKLWKRNIPFELRVAYPTGVEKVVATGVIL